MSRHDHHFSKTLIDWYSIVKRELPWRETRDPYKIWLSEIILQQTRIDQGLPYYNRFVEHYPTIHDLASAPDQSVMKLWEGLGYYSRARNLHATAKYVSEVLSGEFPKNYDGLVKLKGVGPYTAAAIASIAFNEPAPVVDGNVFRFIARYFGVEKDIADHKNRRHFLEILEEVIDHDQPGTFNQAVMEYGATVCKPSAPLCSGCVFRTECFAFIHKKQSDLPIKSKKVKTREVFIHYLVFEYKGQTLMRVRTDSIWTGLFEFHNITAPQAVSETEIANLISPFGDLHYQQVQPTVKHLLTHRKLWVSFTHIDVPNQATLDRIAKDLSLKTFSWEEVLTLPRPKVIVNHLQEAVF
ncbi:MAG: A/G-specific adenine glycosylase [Marinoscillum sp.]